MLLFLITVYIIIVAYKLFTEQEPITFWIIDTIVSENFKFRRLDLVGDRTLFVLDGDVFYKVDNKIIKLKTSEVFEINDKINRCTVLVTNVKKKKLK